MACSNTRPSRARILPITRSTVTSYLYVWWYQRQEPARRRPGAGSTSSVAHPRGSRWRSPPHPHDAIAVRAGWRDRGLRGPGDYAGYRSSFSVTVASMPRASAPGRCAAARAVPGRAVVHTAREPPRPAVEPVRGGAPGLLGSWGQFTTGSPRRSSAAGIPKRRPARARGQTVRAPASGGSSSVAAFSARSKKTAQRTTGNIRSVGVLITTVTSRCGRPATHMPRSQKKPSD